MLDHRQLYQNLERARTKLAQRRANVDLAEFERLYQRRAETIRQFEENRALQNRLSQEFKKVARDPEAGPRMREELKALSDRIREMEKEMASAEAAINGFLLFVPNLPHDSVPVGESEADNVVVRVVGEPKIFDFEAKPHWEVGQRTGVLDLETAAKVSGARFALYRGMGVYLELGLARFMMDVAREEGYEPILPPYMVLRESMMGTGQLPKFEEEA
ncbi:MAG: serine--tRNA ligase, partial [Deltaproteobacteria bacterium]|nr:serine--tRNA ligase [Deltaproteobacteria bacterium]